MLCQTNNDEKIKLILKFVRYEILNILHVTSLADVY